MVACFFGSISPTKARKGSIATLMEASIIAKKMTANNKTFAAIKWVIEAAFGSKTRPIAQRTAPIKKYGFLRPSGLQVLSPICPIIGCTISPVIGATNQNQDNSWTSAPRFCKILLAFPFCNPKAI